MVSVVVRWLVLDEGRMVSFVVRVIIVVVTGISVVRTVWLFVW